MAEVFIQSKHSYPPHAGVAPSLMLPKQSELVSRNPMTVHNHVASVTSLSHWLRLNARFACVFGDGSSKFISIKYMFHT